VTKNCQKICNFPKLRPVVKIVHACMYTCGGFHESPLRQ
jgi:hypothetical protein